jgi:hypothetical protein
MSERPKTKPDAHELTTEQIVKHVFPKKAREAVKAEAARAKSPEKSTKPSTK